MTIHPYQATEKRKHLPQEVLVSNKELTSSLHRKLMAEKPEFAVHRAVVGMLPKGPLGRQMARKLKVYAGAEHEQAAQKPEVLDLK